MSTPVFRFAPSPNGELHLGHALSAIIGWRTAQAAGGRFLLRIEDIDLGRTRDEYIAGIYEDLRWLGLSWEEPVLRQSEHFPVYRAAAERLEGLGLLYPCFATRAEISAAATPGAVDPDGAPLYPRLHRGLTAAEIDARKMRSDRFALRIDIGLAMAAAEKRLNGQPLSFNELDENGNLRTIAARPERWGDAIIVRKDVPTSYHLAVVVDDARQHVTHVTRGLDLRAATDLHRLLQVLLDLPEPLYHHHRLIADETGRKLSKSARDTSLRSLRQAGHTAADVLRILDL